MTGHGVGCESLNQLLQGFVRINVGIPHRVRARAASAPAVRILKAQRAVSADGEKKANIVLARRIDY